LLKITALRDLKYGLPDYTQRLGVLIYTYCRDILRGRAATMASYL
jgi:hypothetical protein